MVGIRGAPGGDSERKRLNDVAVEEGDEGNDDDTVPCDSISPSAVVEAETVRSHRCSSFESIGVERPGGRKE